jgi:hypothetical protein
MAAAIAMLDCIHEALPKKPGDDNEYGFGNISSHNIVIACLPSGYYGTNNAAVVANNMRRSFPSLETRLMVGIGGGVPLNDDIRLGAMRLYNTTSVRQLKLVNFAVRAVRSSRHMGC